MPAGRGTSAQIANSQASGRGRDTRVHNPGGSVTYSSGVTVGPAHGRRQPGAQPAQQDFIANLQSLLQGAIPGTPGETNPFALPGSQTGQGRGGGGGRGGPSRGDVTNLANQLFGFNAAPYDQMRATVGNQRAQANAYNPDFAAMERTFNTGLQARDKARAAAVAERLNALAGFGSQLAGQQGTAMQGALRDLSAQGVNPSGYIDQANRMGAERTQALGNQGGYLGQLNAAAANTSADYANAAGLTRMGGEATLANNRGTLLNQLAQQEAQIGLQQAQAQQQNDQARREFMLKYGVL